MEQIEKLVSIFLNVSEAVAFIWGPIKLALMATMAWKDWVKKLLDVYEEIADALDGLAFFHGLIKSDERFSRMLEDYFSDIILLHRSVLDFFSRPDWKGKFKWAWDDFRRVVRPTIESLKRKQAMLSDDKLQPYAILKEIQDSDQYAKDQFKQINSGLEGVITSEELRRQKMEEQEIRSFLERKLNVSVSQIKSQLEVPDAVTSSSGNWIFSHPLFQSWEVDVSQQGCVLFLTGCPGAGKSTLARKIIHHLNEKRSQQPSSRCSIIHFFFKHNDADRRSTRSLLCHIITQIINADDTMMRFAYDKCSSMDYLDLTVLKSLALDCLSSKRDNVIVLDGLDEGMDGEAERAIKWCLDDLTNTVSSRGCHVRLLICGQEDGRIDPLLAPYPSIRLHAVDLHLKDIEDYCEAQATSIATRFRLSSEDKRGLIQKVVKASNGMFLYTKVVLANLALMGSKKEYKGELINDKFPRDLNEAYEHVVQRVMSSAQASATKILGLLVCAERPLRWREIQARFCIDAEEAVCDPEDLRADTCKQLCSSLVDAIDCEMFPGVESEQTVTMIHETASKYLVYTGTINLMQEHLNMSLFCCRYLSSKPFLAIDSSCLEHVVQSGYFSFMDYAASYYRSHVQKIESFNADTNSDSKVATVEKAALNLQGTYCSTHSNNIGETNTLEANLDPAIQERVSAIRKIIDKQRAMLSENVDFQTLEGPKRHKCSRLQCCRFSVGYPSEAALQQHLASHERPFRCNDGACFAHILGYASQQALTDHTSAFHSEESRSEVTFPVRKKTGEVNLIDACKSGNLREVKLLHLSGADLDVSSSQIIPLMVALKAGHGHICKYFIDSGVNPSQGYDNIFYCDSPIFHAIDRKDLCMLELFLFGPRDVTTTLPHLPGLAWQILNKYPPAISLLLKMSRTEPFLGHSESFNTAIANGLAHLFDSWRHEERFFSGYHSNNTKPLHERFCEIFPRLYDHNETFSVDFNCQEYAIYQQALKQEKELLHDALGHRNYPLAAFLIDIDVEKRLQIQIQYGRGRSPLHSFILNSCGVPCNACVVIAQRLSRLDGGRLANAPDHGGRTPVHDAMMYSIPLETLHVFLECAEDLNRKDDKGKSPLHYVKTKRSLEMLLQQKDVDIFSRNQEGETVFAGLCDVRNRNLVKGDWDHSNLSLEEYEKWVIPRRHQMLEYLLEADMTLAWTADESDQRLTPLHHAIKLGERHCSVSTTEFLLQLPEVEQILQAFLATGVEGSEEVREFALEKNLEHALEAMDTLGFGLPSSY
ncbi:uncharacterized protein B0J16DRAFT_376842 [Fusarium flagelliforme]|uniref:uncharacterized protein n=1 Tax=Fusarium flagelliforme TaxID=2675880 RepID=UPI001E8D25E5|nr:uncharacterized protein B0J16DRAFT_376842 [Fusarium flagelliforme]KAH7196367.1 hypothetical protein B0J16DRAFT_376842 [Fusarium flagelliforme]